jgi:hypothetical protein
LEDGPCRLKVRPFRQRMLYNILPSAGLKKGALMRRLRAWAMLIGFVAVVLGVLWLWWDLDVRWRPHEIKKNQDEIGKLLAGAGWVSPGLKGAKLYLIAERGCTACDAYEQKEFPRLQKAGVDTRVIMIAAPDLNGQVVSTPAERATIAELWANRSWALFQAWEASAPAAWTAPHIAPADGDIGRSALVEASRDLAGRLTPLLKSNGIKPGYPTLIWWTPDGAMEGCNCAAPQTWGPVRKDLGVG